MVKRFCRHEQRSEMVTYENSRKILGFSVNFSKNSVFNFSVDEFLITMTFKSKGHCFVLTIKDHQNRHHHKFLGV